MHITKHLQSENILFEWQHSCRGKRTTETQLLTMVHKLSDSLDRKKQVDIAVLGFSKVFDKASHTHLAITLDYHGIIGTVNWVTLGGGGGGVNLNTNFAK